MIGGMNMKRPVRYFAKSDIKELKDSYLLEIDMPGCKKEDIKAYVDNGYLVVSADVSTDKKSKLIRYILQERYIGSYKRSFFIGHLIHQEDIKASYHHGVLRVRVPKPEKEKNHIEIAG
jgi:HSP20 family molecular chaperone IbpA